MPCERAWCSENRRLPIAQGRQLENCYLCPDLEPCDKFAFLLSEFPRVKTNLLRKQLKLKARDYHRRLEKERK